MTSAFADEPQGALIRVRVTPRSRREEILPGYEEEIRVKLTALPTEGKANEALVKLLARVLNIRRRDVEIASGATSRHKAVRVRGLTAVEVEERLARFVSVSETRRAERGR